MARSLPYRRLPSQRLRLHHRAHGAPTKPIRTSDFVMALVGIVLLAAMALALSRTLIVALTVAQTLP